MEPDLDYVQQVVGPLRGAQLDEARDALGVDRDAVIRIAENTARSTNISNPPAAFIAALRRGEHKQRMRAMDDTGAAGTVPPAAEVLRRLYDAKVGELTRYGVREPERTRIAVDYACSSIHTIRHQPFPDGGIGQLEDELYDAIGFNRVTGLRHAPRAS